MKIFFSIVIIFLLGSVCWAQKTPPCRANPDDLYNRGDVLQKLVGVLKSSMPESYKNELPAVFRVKEERGVRFFIQDLTDPANVQMVGRTGCIDFIDDHVYHFASYWIPISFSHIVILENGKPKFFRAINCLNKGDKLEDVIDYLSRKLKNDKNQIEIIDRVKNYRQYGRYVSIDEEDVLCDEIPKN